jgi:PAS domain S-box-containing protein
MEHASRTVLIVDGFPANRERYRFLLSQNRQYASYTILEASLGMQGLHLWQQQKPDVILLGYPLPDLDDLVFLSQLQLLTSQPDLPVILFIDQGCEAIAARAIEAGAQTYLLKEHLNAETLRIAVDLTITNGKLRQQLQQSQATLQNREEQLKSTLKASRTGLWDWNIQTGQIQWSDNLEPLFGLQPGEFDGSFQMFAERLHPDDRDRVLAAIERAIATGENYELEFRIVYPNGRVRWALSQGKVFYNQDRQPVRMVGNDIDITERKQAEAAVRESEQRYAALTKISPVGIFRTDAQGDCLYMNDRWCELAGLTPLEAKEKGWLNALHPEDRDRVCAEWYRAAELNLPFRSEYRFQTPDGVVSWLIGQATAERDSEGNLIGYVGTVTDITVRKQIEKALKDSEKQFRQLAENIDAVFWIRDAIAQRVSYVSPAYERLWGLNPQELYEDPQTWVNYIHPADRESTDQAFSEKASSGQFDQEYRIVLPNGHVRWVHDRCFPLRSETGEIYRFTGIAEDITDRKQIEEMLRLQAQVIDQTHDAVVSTNLNGFITSWNKGAERVLGYRAEEVLGQHISLLYGLETPEFLETQIIAPLKAKGEHEVEVVAQCKQGDPIHLLLSLSLLRDEHENPVGMIGFSMNITERKRTEAALRENERLLRLALMGAQAGSWDWEIATGKITWSPENYALYGLNPAVGSPQYDDWIHVLHPDDREWMNAEVLRIVEQRLPDLRVEFRVVHPQQGDRWLLGLGRLTLDDQGHPVRLSGINLDITARKQAEQRLQDSEERLQLGMQVSGFALARLDYASDTVELSPEAATLYGLSTDQLVIPRAQLHAIFHPEDRAELMQMIQQVLDPAGPSWFAREHRIVWNNGEVKWLSVRKQVFFDPLSHPSKPNHAILAVLDITDRKHAEAELQESEQMLRLALAGAGQGIWNWDLETQVLTWDTRCKEIFGLPPGFPVSYEWHLEALHSEDRQRVQTAAAIALREHTEFVEEYRTFHPDGTMHWILARGCGFYDAAGQPCRMSGTVMDISERKQAEIDLQERNEHIRLLYETTRDLLSTHHPLTLVQSVFKDLKALIELDVYFNYMLDKPHQKLHLVSYSGISAKQAQEIEWLDVGAAICGTVAQQRSQMMQDNLQQSIDPKAELVRSLGLTAYCCQPLIAQDKLYGTLGFGSRSRSEFTLSERNLFQAICDQIAIALERSELFSSLQQQTEELIRANRIKDEFLAILSHELRSPLNPILGWAKLLQTRTFDAAKTAYALATIERNAKLQTELIDDLLDVAKILRGKLSIETAPVDLVFVVEAAIDTVRAAAIAKNIHLHPILPQIGQVSGDATRLQQVVWNLLSNAIKFTPNRGRVEIRLERRGNQAQITVSDTGKGIKPEFLPYIFESFRQEDATTTRQYGGLGLGLSIVRHLVEAHGGTIRADSLGEGQGTTFTIQLPLLESDTDSHRSEESLEPELDLSGVRALVVDDEPDARELLTVLLTQYGAEVLTVSSAVEVLANLETFQPDVFISDIGMPNMDGFSLMQHIRALPPEKGGQIPAIALTAYARQEDYQQAIANGYQRHVTKPLDPEQLVRAVMVLHTVKERS